MFVFTSVLFAGSFSKIIRFSESDLSFEKIDNYTIVNLKGQPQYQIPGAPMVPIALLHILVPANAIVSDIKILGYQEKPLSGDFILFPAQHPLPISYQGPYVFTNPDPQIYLSNDVYPSKIIDFSSTGTKCGYRIVSVGVFPIRYYPVEHKLSLITELNIEINYSEEKGEAITERQKIFVNNDIKHLVLNPEDINRFTPEIKVADDYEIDCVIITNDALASNFSPLVEWHNQKGFRTEIRSTSSINSSYNGRDLQEKIRNFIIDYFNNRGLKWVILGGDNSIVPARRTRSVVGSETGNIPCDLYYADLQWSWDGNNNNIFGEAGYDTVDFYADVYVGRLSVDNANEITNNINKIFTYERNPDTTYIKKILLPAAYLWSNYNHMLSQDSIERITPIGWVDRKINLGQNDALRYLVRDSLNNGFGLAHLVGHGDDVGIYINYSPQYNTSDPATQTNNNKLVVVNSIACYPGNFEYSDCLAERMMNVPNCAVAVMMNSRYGWGTPPVIGPSEYLDMAFYDIFFARDSVIIGPCFSSSKDYFRYLAEGQQVWRWCVFELNLFGDPVMTMWKDIPTEISITYPDSIQTGGQNINISVSRNGLPVSNATVGVYKPNEVYVHGRTNSFGQVTLSINPLTPGFIYFTATGANCLPKQESLLVTQGAALPYLVIRRITPTQVNLNQNSDLTIVIRNAGTAGASNVIGKLRTNSNYITLLDSLSNYGVVLTNDSASGDLYSFYVRASTPPGTQIPFTINLISDQGSWNYNFNILAGTPPIPGLLFADHDTGYCLLTVTAQGSIGYTAPNAEPGSGFRYPKAAASALYYSSLLIGNSVSYVADRFYGQPASATNSDWIVNESLYFVTPPQFGEEHLRCSYTDAGHPSPKGIKVTQNSYMLSDSRYDDFIILVYDIQNISSNSINGLYSGIIADFDIIASASTSDIARSDATRRLVYMRQASVQNPTVGIKLLTPNSAANLTAIDHDRYVYPDSAMTESMKYRILNGAINQPQSNRTYDWSVGISEGPFNLGPQQIHRAAYAFVGGSSEAAMLANADSAQVWFDRYLSYVAEDDNIINMLQPSTINFNIMPNPTQGAITIQYNILKGGKYSIDLYDISGQQIKQIYQGPINNLYGQIDYQINDLPNGIYFVKFSNNSDQVVQKILLLK